MDYSKLSTFFKTLDEAAHQSTDNLEDYVNRSLEWSKVLKASISALIAESKQARKKKCEVTDFKLPLDLPSVDGIITPSIRGNRNRKNVESEAKHFVPDSDLDNTLVNSENNLERTKILPQPSTSKRKVTQAETLETNGTLILPANDELKLMDSQDSLKVEINEKLLEEPGDTTYVLSTSVSSQRNLDGTALLEDTKTWNVGTSTPILRKSVRANLPRELKRCQADFEKRNLTIGEKADIKTEKEITGNTRKKSRLETNGTSTALAVEEKESKRVSNRASRSKEHQKQTAVKPTPSPVIYSTTSDSEASGKSDSEKRDSKRGSLKNKFERELHAKETTFNKGKDNSKSDLDSSSEQSRRTRHSIANAKDVSSTSDSEKETAKTSVEMMGPPRPAKRTKLKKNVSNEATNECVEIVQISEVRTTRTKTLVKRKNSEMELSQSADVSTRSTRTKRILKPGNSQEALPVITIENDEPVRSTRTKTITKQEAVIVDEISQDSDVPKRSKRTRPIVKNEVTKSAELVNSSQDGDSTKRTTRTKTIRKSKMNPTVLLSSNSVDERLSNEENLVPKKTRTKLRKKDEEASSEVTVPETRMTRTKSKAVQKEAEGLPRKSLGLTLLARKSISRAKNISLKKLERERMLPFVAITPHDQAMTLQSVKQLMSASKNPVLLNSTNKLKTPMSKMMPSTLTKMSSHTKPYQFVHSSSKINMENYLSSNKKDTLKLSVYADKESSSKRKRTRSSLERLVNSVTKPFKDDHLEKELKLQSLKAKEDEARLKKELALQSKAEELKRKNQLKSKQATRQREKLAQEKHNNMLQSEKEKEEKHKMILQERNMKIREDQMKKKIINQQKIAETEERRRLEEEARKAKLKELEAEQQRQMLEKQEQERQEKRAQARLAEQKARELQEQRLRQEQIRQEQLKNEKILAAKKAAQLQSTTKKAKRGFPTDKKEWNYKARNENDYGLEDENSEVDSNDEDQPVNEKPIPLWAQEIKAAKKLITEFIPLEMLTVYYPCHQKTPDITKMFKMTPSKRLKRSSSAIWNTPHS